MWVQQVYFAILILKQTCANVDVSTFYSMYLQIMYIFCFHASVNRWFIVTVIIVIVSSVARTLMFVATHLHVIE